MDAGLKNSSWGLVLDLGDDVPDSALKALYSSIWDTPDARGPHFKMGEWRGLPRAAEGELLDGKCYTKFEMDELGYPPNWQVPLSFSLSLFGFAENLPANQQLAHFLLEKAKDFSTIHSFRLGVIGELSCYYINADLFSEDWLDLHQDSVLALMLDKRHPFAKSHAGQDFSQAIVLYEQSELKKFWTTDVVKTRYQRFKQRIARDLHAPRLGLEWERPNDN